MQHLGCRGRTGLGPAGQAEDCAPPLFERALLEVNVDKRSILSECYLFAAFPIERLASVSLYKCQPGRFHMAYAFWGDKCAATKPSSRAYKNEEPLPLWGEGAQNADSDYSRSQYQQGSSKFHIFFIGMEEGPEFWKSG